MQLCKVQLAGGEIRVGALSEGHVRFLDQEDHVGMGSLSEILYSEDPAIVARDRIDDRARSVPLQELTFLPPLDQQDVWAAGVTYKRSREARERESAGAASFYDLVYTAPRPELFFKATASRVVGHGDPVHVRRDSKWSVPEPELALVLSPHLQIVGYTIGNDMSARDIEGENPLYLPQAKVYDHSCALGPVITLAQAMPPLNQVTIRMIIERGRATVFDGSTSLTAMQRTFAELTHWLGQENSFPHGAILLTGTGIVPPDEFTLLAGDRVSIDVTGIGRLTNFVQQRG
ncbi:MAG TPA: fumarylacetoacetate hydrolase family protein [Gemmataceae bacterium]|nr:fumarylacetoacetate hydrolase family protein [Gemmataceae bacterium]